MFAVRAMRAYRRRDKILKCVTPSHPSLEAHQPPSAEARVVLFSRFECGFHGMSDVAYHNLTSVATHEGSWQPHAIPDTAGIVS